MGILKCLSLMYHYSTPMYGMFGVHALTQVTPLKVFICFKLVQCRTGAPHNL